MELYNIFDKDNHLQPDFDKVEFDTLHGWDFGWVMLEPINIAQSTDEDKELSKRFSPGQKALYFFWYLDGAVTNGGFIQFFWNGYRMYLPAIQEGLRLIGDYELLELVNKADKEYLLNQNRFIEQQAKDDWKPLYNVLTRFDDYDQEYYRIHNNTMELIEKYARLNSDEFVRFNV